jgi:hypothetical protein
MADRRFYRGTSFCSLERELVKLFGSAVIGVAGAVGTVKGMGVESVTKESVDGKYTIKFQDAFKRYMFGNVNFVSAAGSGVAKVEIIASPATFQSGFTSSRSVVIQCYDYAGAEVNPADGSVLSFDAWLRNSSEGPSD